MHNIGDLWLLNKRKKQQQQQQNEKERREERNKHNKALHTHIHHKRSTSRVAY